MLSCHRNISQRGRRLGRVRRHDHQDICIWRQDIDKRAECVCSQLERGEIARHFCTTLLELFDYVADLFESVWEGIWFRSSCDVRDNQERCPFEENNFLCISEFGKAVEMVFKLRKIRNQCVDDFCPGFVEGLVPYARSEASDLHAQALFPQDSGSLLE